MTGPINLWVPTLDIVDSYGRLAHETSNGLRANGWVPREFCLSTTADYPMQGQMVAGGVLSGIPPIFHIYPTLAQIGPRIAMTMFESTRIPADWIAPLNACDGVVVPSPFLIDTFRESGVMCPIHVIPLGISEAFHAYTPRVFTCTEEHPFTFLVIADRGRRKNWADAAQAFKRAFGDDRRYHLILKSRTNVMNFQLGNPNIEVIDQDMNDKDLCALYHRAHVMIFPTRGEGFGFPPREFAATGGLALATRWSGTADDLDQWGIGIDTFTMESAYGNTSAWAGNVGEWAAPDVGALAQQLRDVTDRYATLNADAFPRAQFVRQTYTWTRYGREVGEVYASILERKNTVPA